MIKVRSPLTSHLVRVGVMGHVGRFVAVDALTYPRGARVVCRTCRGLEIGAVLGQLLRPADDVGSDGTVLRSVNDQDELLVQRLDRFRHEAFESCVIELEKRGLAATLVEVEHLFDGESLYFYFLGDVPHEVEGITNQLADAYDAQAQFRQFTDAVTKGCGPGCGTDEGPGCNSACDLCAAAGACRE